MMNRKSFTKRTSKESPKSTLKKQEEVKLSQYIMHKRTRHGFTLIELLIVVSIIGILATVILASLGRAKERAFEGSFRTTMSSVHRAAVLCCNAEGNLQGAVAGSLDPDDAPISICIPGEGSEYPRTSKLSSVNVSTNCQDDGSFAMTIIPLSGTGGDCTSATMTEADLQYNGC